MYNGCGLVIGAVEYDAQRDRFTAATLPLAVGGVSIFYCHRRAVRWIRAQHATHVRDARESRSPNGLMSS